MATVRKSKQSRSPQNNKKPTTDFEIVRYVKQRIESRVIGDIERTMKVAKVGAFILISCAIDYLTSFYSNSDASPDQYQEFVEKYFPHQYDPKRLYNSLRCGLVHNYTIKGKHYSLTDGKPQLHFYPQGGKVILNLENFFNDFIEAKDKYFDEVKRSKKLKYQLVQRYRKVGILGIVEMPLRIPTPIPMPVGRPWKLTGINSRGTSVK